MKYMSGHFNGTGATCYLSLGTIPFHIEFYGLEGATPDTVIWNRCMIHDSLTVEGIMRITGGGAVQDYALGEGVRPYYGGETLTTTLQTSTTYGEGVYLSRDDTDYKHYGTNGAGVSGDASSETITTWTLDTSSTAQGKFNGDVTGTYIGEGSSIHIQETDQPRRVYEVAITALTAGTGESDNEVTLSYPVPSGDVRYIGGRWGYAPTAIGEITTPGMRINLTGDPFTDGETVGFWAIVP